MKEHPHPPSGDGVRPWKGSEWVVGGVKENVPKGPIGERIN